jgi:pimeloyl-ACP methyl ester carboxylesterase
MIPKPPRKLHIDVATADGSSRRMAVHDWGEITNPRVLICVHGLSRNGRDFDVIADALSDQFRVLCPDVIGRGESDWYATATEYAIPNYVAGMQAMLSALAIREYDWIGTSMGGLIGMVMAIQPDPSMRRFVINDVGPEIERAALDRIALYVSARPPVFPDYLSLFNAAQVAIAPFGPLTDEQKHHIIATSCRKREDGAWEFKTDPKIGEAFVAGLKLPPVDLWPLWDSIKQKSLVLRGRTSDLLSESTLNRMVSTSANKRALTVEGTGHAPMLMDASTIAHIREFLISP